ncbi:MAG: leucine--tRNA ligase [Planctomycetota bacterium]|jgi:leucyl-tRNA synthetase
MSYDPRTIEPKWQKVWEEQGLFHAGERPDLPKYYVLDMFPYPSGSGLHVGHTEGYTASDILARYKRMKGFDVLHPMGWDAFGLPAEQYAIEKGVHPETSTRANIENFRTQLRSMGYSYDWRREFATCDPDYYHWTQWIFLKLVEKGLAYQEEALVNWCPALGTVLANDEVIDGKSERGGHEVIRRPMKQWMLRITAYADRLLEGLDRVDFPESIKAMQRDRIGRSEGADAVFEIEGHDARMEIFTTRPDTMFGATFCVLAPEHPLVAEITTEEHRAAVDAYVEEAARKSEIDRSGADAGKSGVDTGAFAINPANGARLPIWVADYVLMGYGTGAIMCVPGHDQRDWDFARTFGLPIVEVITGGDIEQEAWAGDGSLVNSGFLDGLDTGAAIRAMIDWLEEKQLGRGVVRYKLRDWIFARQRYWGEPVPVVVGEDGVAHPLPESALPVELPHLEDFQPTGTGSSPLARAADWVATTVPGTDRPAAREIDTMPGSAGSSAYFLRFIDPGNGETICDPALAERWMPVDLYLGGAEHAVGHLLYSRFWTKFLHDLGVCPVDEPYRKLVNQGMILGEDHRKMSKRYGNVVNPTDVIASHGADSLRVYEMAMGPIEADKPWSTGGLQGAWRLLGRVWRLFFDESAGDRLLVDDSDPTDDQLRLLHRTIAAVDEDTGSLRLNTAIARMTEFVNEMNPQETRPRAVMEPFVLLLAPYAPHLAEEIWERLGHGESLLWHPFPEAESQWLVDDTVEVPVQVNGKIRARLSVATDITEEAIRELAFADQKVLAHVEGRQVVKFIYVPGRMVTVAVKG